VAFRGSEAVSFYETGYYGRGGVGVIIVVLLIPVLLAGFESGQAEPAGRIVMK